MESTIGAVIVIIAVAIVASFVPLVGLIALAWAAYHWVGVYGAVVIVLCWGRYGPGLFTYPSFPWQVTPKP